jgi:hypothetical protein
MNRPNMRIIRKILVAIFAIIGVVTTAILVTGYFYRGDVSLTSLPSPDGKFKALKFTAAGGGAISPYCGNQVEIVSSDASDRPMRGNIVFEVDCKSDVRVEWTGNRALKISFGVAKYAQKVTMSSLDASAKVAVSYEVYSTD